ncbi:OB-fold putative lipoprotein [Luteimonas aquatica]|uniref:OB-fold putative lipoprotein n=1 Tax=Luteimonas aquatica TaxID=450364 RepID=UPI001F590EAC|nr:OB-fold putative lipoprotein [Luteimonas aquatica]
MKRQCLLAALLLAAAAPAFAGSCEDNFQKKGNPLTGTTYTTSVTLPDLSVKSAIGQMRVIAKESNMDVLSEDADAGSMLIEEPETFAHKPIPVIVSATSEGGSGTVGMTVKLNRGAFAKADSIRSEMCQMLVKIKSGKAGEQFAKTAPKASVVNITADKFGFQLRNQHKDNPAAIEARYQGKTYAITGRVNGVLKSGGTYNTGFEMVGDGSGGIDFERVAITCAFAPSQTAFALALRPKEKVTLVGVVDHYDQIERVLWLKDCKGS